MKKLITAAALFLSLTAHAEFYSGNDLLAKLTSESVVDRSVGHGYILGAFDSLNNFNHCAPKNVTGGQVRDMVISFLRDNPADRHHTADQVVHHVLKHSWPCAANKPTSSRSSTTRDL